jgi:L-malate glycosyltransferase
MRVLYVSHTASVSGGERSLIDFLGAVGTRVQPTVATPRGQLSRALEPMGVPVRTITGTAGSLKPHPIHTPRTVLELSRAAWAVRRLAQRESAEIVHANSIRAGIVVAAAARVGGPPAVVHVRDVLPDGPLTRLTQVAVGEGASAIVGNSAHTLKRFAHPRTTAILAVAHSPVDLDRLSVATELDQRQARAALGIPPDAAPILGMVAQLTPWKAQDDAIRIVAGLRATHPGVRLLIAGSAKFLSSATRHDNRAFVQRLKELVDELELGGQVVFLGERSDVPELLRALDIALVPSWEEPLGRAVIEALACGVPVAATSVGGPSEIMCDGVEGLLLPPRRPDAWVTALSALLNDPLRMAEMGRRGRARASAFDPHMHADRLVSIYEEVLALSSKGGAGRTASVAHE